MTNDDKVFYIAFAVGFVSLGALVLWVALATGSDVAALLTLIAVSGLAGLCV